MSKKSTAFRLSAYISASIISVLIAFIVIAYNQSRRTIRENVENKAISESSQIITEIRDHVVLTQEIASNTVEQIPYYVKHNDLRILVSSLISRYKFIHAINIEFEKNIFPDNSIYYKVYKDENEQIVYVDNLNKPIIDGTERIASEYFIKSRTAGWTEPYLCSDNGETVSGYSHPVYMINKDSSIYAGNIIIELSLSYLTDKIKNIEIGMPGFAFLVSEKGTYITFPDHSRILTGNIYNKYENQNNNNKQFFNNKIEKGASGNSIAYPEYLDYQKSWVYYTPVPENSWNLIFVVPYSKLFKESRDFLINLILISVTGLIIIFFLITFISQKLMNPLALLSSDIHEFSTAGRGEEYENEVDALSNSFNQIKIWYEKFKNDQEKLHNANKFINKDLKVASGIQQSIIPAHIPAFKGKDEIDIYSTFKPAFLVGGDLYDYFMVDEDHLLITIGDVSGKGVSAALFMGIAHTLLKSNSSKIDVRRIVKEINKELVGKNKYQYFLTLFIAVLNLKTGKLNYCNAAHTTSFILKGDGSILVLNDKHGLPLGLYSNKEWEDSSINISANDVLLLYTDGVTEMINDKNNHFGEKRLKEVLKKLKGELPFNIIENIEKTLKIYRNGLKQNDDYSIVALKYNPNKKTT